MDIIDIITTVIEFSQKDEEFSDEIKAVRATLESLHLTIQHVDQHDLPAHMIEILNENIEEAGDLLKKVSSESTRSWWTSLKNMLPGSNLQKLKEKNQQLLHIINLLNLHLNALKSNKRVAPVDLNSDDEELEGSQPIKKVKLSSSCIRSDNSFAQNKSLSISTTSSKLTVNNEKASLEVKSYEVTQITSQLQPELKPQRPAFTLKLLCDKKIGEILSKGKEVEPVLTEYWDDNGQATYEFHRYSFPDLPSPELMKMSKDHAIITAMCCPKSKKQETGNYQKLEKSDENNPNIVNKSAQIINEEEKGDKSSEYKYILKDQSLNGTYYLKNFNPVEVSLKGVEIKANFLHLKKGEQIVLEHGDIIALVVHKPKCDELIFGFQFLTS